MKFSKTEKSNFWLGLGLVNLLLATITVITPPQTRPSGGWTQLLRLAWDSLGPYGVPAYWFVQGALVIFIGLFLRRTA